MNFGTLQLIAEREGWLIELDPDMPMQEGDFVAWMSDGLLTDLQTIGHNSPMIGSTRRTEWELSSTWELKNKHRVFRVVKG